MDIPYVDKDVSPIATPDRRFQENVHFENGNGGNTFIVRDRILFSPSDSNNSVSGSKRSYQNYLSEINNNDKVSQKLNFHRKEDDDLQLAINALENEISKISVNRSPPLSLHPTGSPQSPSNNFKGQFTGEEAYCRHTASILKSRSPILSSSSCESPIRSEVTKQRDNYEVITYFNDIYAPSQSGESANSSPEKLNTNTYLSPASVGHATKNKLHTVFSFSENSDFSPSQCSRLRSVEYEDQYPNEQHYRLQNGTFLNLPVDPFIKSSEDSKSNISEMSSVCEFDSEGEEIDFTTEGGERFNDQCHQYHNNFLDHGISETNQIGQNGLLNEGNKSTGKLNENMPMGVARILQPITDKTPFKKQPGVIEVAKTIETKESTVISPQKIDKYGFFGGQQYIPPPIDDDDDIEETLKSETLSHANKTSGLSSKQKINKHILNKDTSSIVKLRNREKKWKGMLDHWDKYSRQKPDKIKDRCRKGIPPAFRGLAWQYLCGVPAARGKNTALYGLLASEQQKGDPLTVDEIKRDLHRQFPYHEMFSSPDGAGQRDLFNVLKVYSLMRPKDGYCQAQAPIAAVLLMQMPAEPAFWCLLSICDEYLPGYFGPGLESLQLDGQVFYALLKRFHPSLYRLVKKQGIQPSLCVTEWFMCLYSRTLPWPCVLRVWDIFLCEGVGVLFKVGLILFKLAFSIPPQVAIEVGGGNEAKNKSKYLSKNVKEGNSEAPQTSRSQPKSMFGSLPLLHSFGASSLSSRFPSMYETMGALQALKSKNIGDDFLIDEIVKLKIPKELFEKERLYLKKRR
ncbi:unnamed protein product [Gordionus sp. m RMFG-2023]